LRAHEPFLRALGVKHAGIFGSVARGEPDPRDVDVLLDIDGAFGTRELLEVRDALSRALGCAVDVVGRGGLKPKHAAVLAETVSAF
jgi:predicted nucleotidyltransferase